MPSRNSVKIYLENTYYHIYNRGIEGKNIFRDDKDYKVFLSFIKRYLTPPDQNEVRPRWKQGMMGKLELSCYSLMPNHFHLLVRQISRDGITNFMRALMNCYVRYYNQRYKRVGGLFQGKFKAVQIENDAYLLHLTRYIHMNPLDTEGMTLERLEDHFCSYGEYIGKRITPWINHKEILANFGSKLVGIDNLDSYRDFVEKYKGDSAKILERLILE